MKCIVLSVAGLLYSQAVFAGNYENRYNNSFEQSQFEYVARQKQINKSKGTTILATYYGFEMGRNARTANGEHFNPNGLTAAHKTLPFGTKIWVLNPKNNKSVVVRISDRGPYRRGYSLDLSAGAARSIGFSSGRLIIRIL